MKRIIIGLLAVGGLAACDDPSRPTSPSSSAVPTAALPAASRFSLQDLGTLGGTFSVAFIINERDEAIGVADLPSGRQRAFLWRPGRGLRNLGTLGGANSFSQGVNDLSDVVGISEITPGSDAVRAFLWTQAGGMQNLGTLAGNSFALNINNRREVVGASDNRNGRQLAVIWRPGRGPRSLGTLGGDASVAFDINDATQVVGGSDLANGESHAFIWTEQRGMEDLGTLGGPFSFAVGISQTGEVVGSSATDQGTVEAFIWSRDRGMRSLGTLGGRPFAEGRGVNTHQRVVGTAISGNGVPVPFLWLPESGIRRLPTLGGGTGEAWYLNEFGKIIGHTTTAAGELHATLWSPNFGPLSEPPEEVVDASAAASDVTVTAGQAAMCALGRKFGNRTRLGLYAARAC